VPFVTENDKVEKFFPTQIKRADLFKYVESELLAIEPLMVNAKGAEYGRADKAAVWALLAKLYLNAEVYIGQPKFILNASRIVIILWLQDILLNLNIRTSSQPIIISANENIFFNRIRRMKTRTYGGQPS